MPRRLVYHNPSAGDPQTMLQEDKDPMLTLNPDYLDCNSDTDPAGDLGKVTDDPTKGRRHRDLKRLNSGFMVDALFCPPVAGLPIYKALACKAPMFPAVPIDATEPKPSDIDVSDLGSRNYGTRSDFYCLVTEADI